MVANPLGYSPDVLKRLGSSRDCPPYAYAGFHATETARLIRDFCCEEFTRDVPTGFEHLYIPSAAVAEKHFGGMIDAVIYPTLAQFGNADNLAIEPRFADEHVRFL